MPLGVCRRCGCHRDRPTTEADLRGGGARQGLHSAEAACAARPGGFDWVGGCLGSGPAARPARPGLGNWRRGLGGAGNRSAGSKVFH